MQLVEHLAHFNNAMHVVTTYPHGLVLLQILTALLDRAKQQQQGRALCSLAANTDFLQQLGIVLLEAANEPDGTQLAEKTMQVCTQNNQGRLPSYLHLAEQQSLGWLLHCQQVCLPPRAVQIACRG